MARIRILTVILETRIPTEPSYVDLTLV